MVPEFIHWKSSRMFFHLPDAAQGVRSTAFAGLEAYLHNLMTSPSKEKIMEFKETFTLLCQVLFRYRYAEPIRRRAEVAACGLCDARAREERRSVASADEAVAVAFCIMSRRSAHELRKVVRETWGRGLAGKAPAVVQRFFVGKAANSSHALHDSSAGDVVELPVVESYRTLNIKALSMLSWAHRRYPNLQWLVRHDDDVYLRAPALLAQLASRPPIRYLWGMFDHGSSPVRDPAHQHYNSYEQFPKQDHPAWGDIFPPYARGLLWAMSADLVAATVKEFMADREEQPDVPLDEAAADHLPHPDDPAVGVLIAGLVQRGMSINLDDRDFNSFSLNPSCNSTFSNIHNRTITTRDMRITIFWRPKIVSTHASFWEEVQRRRQEERQRQQPASEASYSGANVGKQYSLESSSYSPTGAQDEPEVGDRFGKTVVRAYPAGGWDNRTSCPTYFDEFPGGVIKRHTVNEASCPSLRLSRTSRSRSVSPAKEDAWTEDPWQKHDPWKAKDPWKDSWAQAEDPWTSQEDPWAAETKDYQRSSWGGDNSDKKWTTWNAIEAWGDKLVEVDWTTRPPIDIKKDFYSECANPLAENRSAEEVAAIRHSDDIEIIDGDSSVPHPICSFEETCFPDDLMDRLTEQHFQEPSPIQKQIWPLAMQGRDLVGIAETGSGKTVAYILPMIVHISYQALLEKGDGPVALIFAPTRELASQIKEQCDLYGLPRGIKTCTIVGGTPSRQQREWLEDKNDIVVATPGRFMNALGDGWVTLNRATYVVLDEADEMLKKEFYDQIKLILSQVRKERQVLMFSATWPEEVKCFAQEICTASDGMPPVVVRIGGSKLAACKFIEQHTVMVDGEDEKYEQLLEKLQSPETFKDDSKAIIFCRTRGGVQRLVDRLKEEHFLWNENNDFMVACLHGELQQHDRDYAMKRFRSGEVPCVVSTGVLARGHDIPKVRFVFNYDLPSAPEDYIHRIGRTGRAGAKGYAMSFVDRSSWKEMESSSLFLMDVLKATDQKVEPDLKDAVDSYQKTQVWNEEETGNENGRNSWKRDLSLVSCFRI
eukprot:g15020.t1